MDALAELQRWYAARCDGDWEHHGGFEIENVDNPGWFITVDFNDHPHPGIDAAVDARTVLRSETDFVQLRFLPEEDRLQIFCGALNLAEALGLFLTLDPA